MKAKITVPVMGVPDGECHPIQFRPGDPVEGDLARALVEAGYAQSLGGAPKNQALGGAPKNQFRGAEKVAGGNGRRGRKRAKSHKGAG